MKWGQKMFAECYCIHYAISKTVTSCWQEVQNHYPRHLKLKRQYISTAKIMQKGEESVV